MLARWRVFLNLRILAAVVSLSAAWASPGAASETSELWVTKGEVAYHAGDYEQARSHLERAVAADPSDAQAHYVLGIVLGALGRWSEAEAALTQAMALQPENEAVRTALARVRAKAAPGPPRTLSSEVEQLAPVETITRIRGGRAAKRWEVRAALGTGYDDNVPLAPGSDASTIVSDEDDAFVTLSVGGRYDLLARKKALLRVEYDLFNKWHLNVHNVPNDQDAGQLSPNEFDLQSHRPRGTASYALRNNLWVGIQSGYNYYRLDRDDYLTAPFALPFVSYTHASGSLSQGTFRWQGNTYRSGPFEDVRDGDVFEFGLSHTLYRAAGRYLTLSYAFGKENPSGSLARNAPTATGPSSCSSGGESSLCPRDFEYLYNQVGAAVGFPLWGKTFVDVSYRYQSDNYQQPNSEAGFRKSRYDDEHHLFAQVAYPYNEYLRLVLAYFGSFNPSNIDVYDYDRNTISGRIELVY